MEIIENKSPKEALKRRTFLRYAIAGASVATLTVAGCRKRHDDDGFPHEGEYLGSGDVAILNYAYALEQLEAAFYTQVITTPYSGITAMETSYLTDIRDHEIAHREFFKAAIGSNAIRALEVNLSSINFSSRDSVLATAKAFEDLGVSAYNGAGRLIKDPKYLLIAGKIVSVEARHAALIRDLISYGTFADNTVVGANGLDTSKSPSSVLEIASTYIKTKLNTRDLPTY